MVEQNLSQQILGAASKHEILVVMTQWSKKKAPVREIRQRVCPIILKTQVRPKYHISFLSYVDMVRSGAMGRFWMLLGEEGGKGRGEERGRF